MKIVIVSNAYKGSRTSMEVAYDIERGIRKVIDAEIIKLSVADGGDGTLDALVSSVKGEIYHIDAKNPIGVTIKAPFGILSNGKGVIEMALISGLALMDKQDRTPMKASSYGMGQIITELLNRGVREIILGIGGSATNDGGTGMAEALGVRFYDKNNDLLHMNGENLLKLARIDTSNIDKRIKNCHITVACDVTNPLYGPTGAAYVYASQKGATEEQIPLLDNGLINLSNVLKLINGYDYANVKGAGAAGGMGYGLMTFLGAKLLSGIDTMLTAIEYDKYLEGADLVITGEGMLDYQSAYGKVPSGVAIRAKAKGIPVIAIVGSIGEGAEKLYDVGISAIISIAEGPCNIDYSLKNASKLITNCAERVMRIMELK